MKVMTARDAKNHFGEFLDSARREPVVVTKNDRPVGIMISVEDAADTLFADLFVEGIRIRRMAFWEGIHNDGSREYRQDRAARTFGRDGLDERPPGGPSP